jgi:hypothetical protein
MRRTDRCASFRLHCPSAAWPEKGRSVLSAARRRQSGSHCAACHSLNYVVMNSPFPNAVSGCDTFTVPRGAHHVALTAPALAAVMAVLAARPGAAPLMTETGVERRLGHPRGGGKVGSRSVNASIRMQVSG